MHDPVAVAFAIRPDMFVYRDAYVEVDYKSDLSRGSTVADVYGIKQAPPNCRLVRDVNLKEFWEVLGDAVHLANE